jgi:hypothetical protein
MEDILYHYDAAKFLTMSLFIEHFLFLGLAKLTGAQFNAKLFMADFTFKNELLPLSILCLIECDVVVALGALNSLHAVLQIAVLLVFSLPASGSMPY